MILGIGVDLLSLDRVEKLYLGFSNKFAKKILSEEELLDFDKLLKNQVAYLAKKFCAKEAFSKALGTGIGRGVDFCDITIAKNILGKPYVKLSNRASQFIQKHYNSDIKKIQVDLSITDEKPYVNCFVIISSNN